MGTVLWALQLVSHEPPRLMQAGDPLGGTYKAVLLYRWLKVSMHNSRFWAPHRLETGLSTVVRLLKIE
jgi:hypothetical protein